MPNKLQVTEAIVGIVDNLVNVTTKQSIKPTAIVDILEAFETQITKSTEQGGNISVVEPNIVLKTTTIKPNKERKTGLSFAVRSTSNDKQFQKGDLIQLDNDNVTKHEKKTRPSISFPAALFDVASNGKENNKYNYPDKLV